MGVIDRLKKHILVDGFHIVVDPDASRGPFVKDAETGVNYLDCYSQFASQPFGWNYGPFVEKAASRGFRGHLHKLANSDMYSEVYADFVETFAGITPDFKHHFFIEGGAPGVENALKAAFDWKCQTNPIFQLRPLDLDVVHLREAFHGRTGYTLSLTNTGDVKTKWYPTFSWTRVNNPKLRFPADEAESRRVDEVEQGALAEVRAALAGGRVAAVIVETIQGEGGDNHFRPSFFQGIRKLCDEFGALMVLDEVQCGMGITGQWWAYQHTGVRPDLICFGKKSQVCGFCANERIDSAPENVFVKSGRINSTWGGNSADMERARMIIEVVREQDILANVRKVGAFFLKCLQNLDSPEVTNVRGSGLMLAFDLPTPERRDEVLFKLHENNLLALKSGERSVRFRPALTFTAEDVDLAVRQIRRTLGVA